MKSGRFKDAGLTLIEVLVTLTIVTVVGAILLSAIHAIAVNSAKNSAINLAHQQTRQAIHRVVSEIRESASIPRLIGTDLQPLSGSNVNGPAAGVSYQVIVAGPYRVWNNATANTQNIRVFREFDQGSARGLNNDELRQASGLRLIVPAFQIESDVSSIGGVPGQSTVHNVHLTSNLGVNITCQAGTPVYPAYFTRRAALVVINGELRHYENISSGQYVVIARNIEGDQPFTVPGGNNRFISFAFKAKDSRVSNRGYKAVSMQMNLTIPYRYQLTTRQ